MPGSGLYGPLELTGLLVLLVLAAGLLAAYWLWYRGDRRAQLGQQRPETANGLRQTELKPMMTITSNGSGNMILPAQGNQMSPTLPFVFHKN